jgi:hypothetical protein
MARSNPEETAEEAVAGDLRPGEWARCVAQTAPGVDGRCADNLHSREPQTHVNGSEKVGFQAYLDDGDHTLLVQPHPGGYQFDLWSATPGGDSADYLTYGEASRERVEIPPIARTATASGAATPDHNNRHERTPVVEAAEAASSAGFNVVFADGDHRVKVQPHPFGYLATLSDTALSAGSAVDTVVLRYDRKRDYQTATPDNPPKAARVADLEARQRAEPDLRLGGDE